MKKIESGQPVVAVPKPNKPLDDAKSYCPVSLLCIPYKIFERLIYTGIEPTIDPCSHKNKQVSDAEDRL